MNILLKFKETAISVLPIVMIVLLLGFTIVPLDKILLFRFVISAFFLIIGLTIFLLGVDVGIQPVGQRTGAELTKKRNIALLLSVAFLIGFIVTAAEPDIQVFSSQVNDLFPFVNKLIFTFTIAAGVGLFIIIGLLRSVLNFSIKWVLFLSYLALFIALMFAPKEFTGVAFDSGGATTGPMTVPFIMAIGLGVSSVQANKEKSENNSFGLTGICSVGPVMAVIIYSIIMSVMQKDASVVKENADMIENIATITTPSVQNNGIFFQAFSGLGKTFLSSLKETFISIGPLFLMFLVFQVFLLKMTKRQVVRIIIGFIYSFIGLSLFLTGVHGGFMQVGESLGLQMGLLAQSKGGLWLTLLIITGVVFGAIIVCAEPAVWCLSEQVEQVSGGTIKRKLLLVFLSCATAIAIALSLWRCILNIDLKYFLIAGYTLSFILMLFCPSLFSSIAFDSGGVASGPLTSTFVLSFTIGAANCVNGTNDCFGVIALVAMMPLIAIQIMGIMYKIKTGGKNAV